MTGKSTPNMETKDRQKCLGLSKVDGGRGQGFESYVLAGIVGVRVVESDR